MTTTYPAVPCSPGAALAPGWRPRGAVPDQRVPVPPATPDTVRSAFEATATRLDDLAASFRADGAVEYADILEAEALIARDPAFADEVVALLDDPGTDATSAVMQVAERHAAVMAGLASADLRERAADIRQVGRMVSDRLGGRVPPAPPAGPFVLLAHEVTAPDLLEYAEQVTGAVSVLGGAGSHASIVARSLGVPLVVGVDPAALDAPAGVTSRSTATAAPSWSTRTPPRWPGCAPARVPRRRPTSPRPGPGRPAPPTAWTSRCWPTSPPAPRHAGRSRLVPPASGCCGPSCPSWQRPTGRPASSTRTPCARCSRCCAADPSPCGCSTSPTTRSRRSCAATATRRR